MPEPPSIPGRFIRLRYTQTATFHMALHIKDPQTEALAAEVAALANETKT
jgi:Rv0623-like transcription factor